jgi:hypothetical protein
MNGLNWSAKTRFGNVLDCCTLDWKLEDCRKMPVAKTFINELLNYMININCS